MYYIISIEHFAISYYSIDDTIRQYIIFIFYVLLADPGQGIFLLPLADDDEFALRVFMRPDDFIE